MEITLEEMAEYAKEARTLYQMPGEQKGRTKPDEWEALYGALFRQMQPILDENKRMKGIIECYVLEDALDILGYTKGNQEVDQNT